MRGAVYRPAVHWGTLVTRVLRGCCWRSRRHCGARVPQARWARQAPAPKSIRLPVKSATIQSVRLRHCGAVSCLARHRHSTPSRVKVWQAHSTRVRQGKNYDLTVPGFPTGWQGTAIMVADGDDLTTDSVDDRSTRWRAVPKSYPRGGAGLAHAVGDDPPGVACRREIGHLADCILALGPGAGRRRLPSPW